MWFQTALNNPGFPLYTHLLLLGFLLASGAWSHSQMIVGWACDCPKPHALLTSSSPLISFLCRLALSKHHRRRNSSSHRTSLPEYYFLAQYTPLRFRFLKGHVSHETGWRFFDTTVFLPITTTPPPTQSLFYTNYTNYT
jgi:hypothetical protein